MKVARRLSILPVVGALTLAAGAGCGGGTGATTASTTGPERPPPRDLTLHHEPCEEGGKRVESFDTNSDGKPDLRRVFEGAREVCRVSDLNRDGTPDLYEYFGPGGELRRREANYDDTPAKAGQVIITSIDTFEGGRRVRRDLDTTGQRRIDTWDFFDPASGKRTRRERDVNGDGYVDQWWTWEGEKLTIAFSKGDDGLPDPATTMVMGAAAGPGAAPPVAPTAAPADAGAPTAAATTAATAPAAPPAADPASTAATTTPTATAVTDAGAATAATDAGAKKGIKGK